MASTDPADRHPHLARLRVGSILAGALRLYRLAPVRVAGASLVVLLPLVFLGAWVHGLETSLGPGTEHQPGFLLTVLPSVSEMLALLGLVVLGGVMDELVGAAVRGEAMPKLTAAARSLPLGALVVADLVVVLLVGVGGLLGAIPGLVVASLVGIVGPVVNIERHGPARAVRRSVGLTAPHVVLAIAVVVPCILVEAVAHGFLVHVWDALGVLGELAVEIPIVLTIGAFVVLTEVVLAYALLARDPSSRVAAMVHDAIDAGGGAGG